MERYISEPQRQIPILDEADVVVVGGGPSGIAAAVASARSGAKTILLERYGCLGGNITICNMEPVNWYRQPRTANTGGIGAEFELRMGGIEYGSETCNMQPSIGLSYNTEMFKQMADEMVLEAGVKPYFHIMGAMPYMEGNEVKGVITESKSGRQAILCKQVVDCTGDADIAARAGVPYLKGDEHGKTMAVTLVFGLSGIDPDVVLTKEESYYDRDALVEYLHELK